MGGAEGAWNAWTRISGWHFPTQLYCTCARLLQAAPAGGSFIIGSVSAEYFTLRTSH